MCFKHKRFQHHKYRNSNQKRIPQVNQEGKNSVWLGKANGRLWGAEGKVGVGFLLFISSVVLEIGNLKNPPLTKLKNPLPGNSGASPLLWGAAKLRDKRNHWVYIASDIKMSHPVCSRSGLHWDGIILTGNTWYSPPIQE